ncbi:testis-expressed protein 9 [Sphaerodactylus townsendi]|uniref:Uncharacterized protein n=1 Tax=Sphaerodactylus townsendi TaxID=933632 RepID=A0ACB8E557_9SAUR|nr:testis-expressed protein 9 [Sphaerodactylus townsendi]
MAAAAGPCAGRGGGGGRRGGSALLAPAPPEGGPAGVPAALLAKEREYKRLNAELEAKTAALVRQAEQAVREQHERLSRPPSAHPDRRLDEDPACSRDLRSPEPPTLPHAHKPANKKPGSAAAARPRTQSGKKRGATVSSAKSGSRAVPSAAADVAVPDFSLAKTIGKIEAQLEEGGGSWPELGEDPLLSPGSEIGTEAQIRFLKAKLRVMQEELDSLARECSQKDDESRDLTLRLKEAEEAHKKLQRTSGTQQAQLDKYKQLAEEANRRAEGLQQQLSGLEKELETLKRAQKQASASQGTMEVRLNRALEEAERAKLEVTKMKESSKHLVNQEHQKLEELRVEKKRLEKQKGELMSAFTKQLKLIDVLKRQKMHIEAAKMLSFTEEEFMKALEWGNS